MAVNTEHYRIYSNYYYDTPVVTTSAMGDIVPMPAAAGCASRGISWLVCARPIAMSDPEHIFRCLRKLISTICENRCLSVNQTKYSLSLSSLLLYLHTSIDNTVVPTWVMKGNQSSSHEIIFTDFTTTRPNYQVGNCNYLDIFMHLSVSDHAYWPASEAH